jgi:hypothetical protein
MYEFKGEGLKTAEGAMRRLLKVAAYLGECKSFVAYQDGEYFPVVIYREGQTLNIPALCGAGIHVLN